MPAEIPDKPDYDLQKFMYDKMYDELNRCRDWPIKVLTFTSAFYFALIGFINLKGANLTLIQDHKAQVISIVLFVAATTIYVLIVQHLRYLDYRNIQIRLQKYFKMYDWEAEGEKVFPGAMKEYKKRSIATGFQGWGFYSVYVLAITVVTIMIITSI